MERIIEELGEDGDSYRCNDRLHIADPYSNRGNEETFDLDKLYRCCEIGARIP